MRSILLTLAAFLIGTTSYGQYLYGFSAQGFKKKHLNTGQDTVIFPNLFFYDYQANTTSDLDHRYFCVVKDYATSTKDTLLTIDLSHNTVTKDLIPFGGLLWPEYYNNKIYGLSENGFVVFDLQTKQLSTINPTVRGTHVQKAGMNQSTGIYVFLKGVGNSAYADTVCSYNIGTGMYTTDTIPGNNYNFEYCAAANKAFMIGLQNGVKGVYYYDMATQTYGLAGSMANASGILSGIATTDPVNNKFYFIIAGNGMAADTLSYYSLGNNLLVKTAIPKNSLSNIEFFPQLPTDVPDMANEAKMVSFYPNPASNRLHIKLNNDKQWQLSVANISGKILLWQRVTHSTNIDVSQMPPGQYFLTVTDGARSETHLFQKQ